MHQFEVTGRLASGGLPRAEVYFTEMHQFEGFFALLLAVFQKLPVLAGELCPGHSG